MNFIKRTSQALVMAGALLSPGCGSVNEIQADDYADAGLQDDNSEGPGIIIREIPAYCERHRFGVQDSECVREAIYLNFNGFEERCYSYGTVGELYDMETYCPVNEDGTPSQGNAVIEGFEGIHDREAEIAEIVDFIRCKFEPLGFTVTTERPESGDYNQVNIGGQATIRVENGMSMEDFTFGRSGIDLGNDCHNNDIFILEKVRLTGEIDGTAYARRNLIGSATVHELSHALGIEHTGVADAIMNPQYDTSLNVIPAEMGELVEYSLYADICDRTHPDEQASVLASNTANFCAASEEGLAEESQVWSEAWTFGGRCEAECDDLSVSLRY